MSLYPLTDPIIDGPAPGTNTDILPDDVVLPPGHKGYMEVKIQVALATSGLLKIVDKPREGIPDEDVLGAKATGSIQAIASSLLADGDYFTLKDGVHTVLFEFERVRAATGQITAIQGSLLVDGQVFVLNDGVNPPVTFNFDSNASVTPSGTLRAITFTGSETALAMAALIVAAINSAPTLAITATNNLDGTISLVNDVAGTLGNHTITETVVNAGFIVAGMSGGLGTVGVTGGRTAVTIDPAATVQEVAEEIVDTINGIGAGLTLTASIDEDDDSIVDLVNDDFGVVGNQASTENVTNAGFTVSGMSGGYGGDTVETLDINGTDALAASSVYVKTYLFHSSRQYNFQLPTDGIVGQLYVAGVRG